MDLLSAVHELTLGLSGEDRRDAQLAWLQRLSVYHLRKNADQDQNRPPEPLSRLEPVGEVSQ